MSGQCASCGGDCGYTKKSGCQYEITEDQPTIKMLKAGIKAFQHARYSESNKYAEWRAFYIASRRNA